MQHVKKHSQFNNSSTSPFNKEVAEESTRNNMEENCELGKEIKIPVKKKSLKDTQHLDKIISTS